MPPKITKKDKFYPLVGKLKLNIEIDHAKMARFDSRIEKAASAYSNKNLEYAGAEDREITVNNDMQNEVASMGLLSNNDKSDKESHNNFYIWTAWRG